MIKLEKLYKSAEKHLSGEHQDWERFASEFETIFGAKMSLTRPALLANGLNVSTPSETIVTSCKESGVRYYEDKIYEYDEIFDNPENQFEPKRSSESLHKDTLKTYDIYKKFLREFDIFHMMVIYAVLPNGLPLVLLLWRSEQQSDFSDLEKQRIAIFMRYLATLIKVDPDPVDAGADISIALFGEKYGLTKTEVDVLTKLLQGHSLKVIAWETGKAYRTIRWHVQNILEKCQVKSQKNLLTEFYSLIKH